MANDKILTRVALAEEDKISRVLLIWFNEYADKPAPINFEYLSADAESMALSLIQGAYKTRRYIGGGYEAECQFKIIYRLKASNNNQRLAADELLNAIASWALTREDAPYFGDSITFKRFTSDARAALFAQYENGDEDHQILMTMTYEVI